jgi:hypothetical protein
VEVIVKDASPSTRLPSSPRDRAAFSTLLTDEVPPSTHVMPPPFQTAPVARATVRSAARDTLPSPAPHHVVDAPRTQRSTSTDDEEAAPSTERVVQVFWP